MSSLDGNYTFGGIGAAEAKDREDEYRTGVPPLGAAEALLAAPARRTTGLRVMNQGSETALVRLAHGSSEKTQSGEYLTAQAQSTTEYKGKLQFGSIKPGTVIIQDSAGSPKVIVDDGDGVLHDQGNPSAVRGSIDYTLGTYSVTFASAVTEAVTATYDHTDWTDFRVSQSQSFTAAGAYSEEFALQFGRLVPGTVTLTDGSINFADDGKGNMIQTDSGNVAAQGSVDYATGIITLDGGSAPLSAVADAVTVTAMWNPFAALVVAGGGQRGVSILPGDIPELSAEPWADGLKGETEVALLGESRTAKGTDLVTMWAHHVEDPYRVRIINSGFPAGGQSNDPRVRG